LDDAEFQINKERKEEMKKNEASGQLLGLLNQYVAKLKF
jgi:hypothetical protein